MTAETVTVFPGGAGRRSFRSGEIVVLDPALPDPEAVRHAASARGAEVLPLAEGCCALAQIAAALFGRSGLTALHVVSHGRPGALRLAGEDLDAAGLERRSDLLARIGAAIAPGGGLWLYGCALASGAGGRSFLSRIAALTGRPVAASAHPVGAAALGGGWDLSRRQGRVRGSALHIPGMAGLLATFTVTNLDASGAGSLAQAVTDANANAGADEIVFASGVTGTITPNADIRITESVTITGPGTGNLSIAGATRFVIDDSDDATLQNVSIKGLTFYHRSQAPVDNRENLTIEDVFFNDVASPYAGIIYSYVKTSILNIKNVSFDNITVYSYPIIDARGKLNVDGLTVYNLGNYTGSPIVGVVSGSADSVTISNINLSNSSLARGLFHYNTSFAKVGTDTLNLNVGTAASASYTGTITVREGAISIGSDGDLIGATVALNGGALNVTGATTIDNSISVGANGGTLALSADVEISSAISGSGTLTKTGASTLTLSGSNTLSGTINVSEGTLKLSGGNAIADGATVNVGAGATLDLNGTTETIGALTGSGTVTTGAGSLTLSNPAASSFSGTLSGTGTFSVASGATLGGTGTYSMPVTVMSGASIAPGNSPGILSTGNLTLASGSTATMEINGTTAGTGYDQINVTGTVTINSATLKTVLGYTSATGDSYVLINNDGADPVTGTFGDLAEGAIFTGGTRQYQISYAGNDGNDVTLTDVGAAPVTASDSAPATFLGGSGADILSGTDGADQLTAMAGDDAVYGRGGTDLIYGNQGADSLWGGADADSVYSGQGADLVYGNQGADTLWGNLGADSLYGGQDGDRLIGGEDGDRLWGNQGDDLLYGNQGADTLSGGAGLDTLYGGQGDDTLVGGGGYDYLTGGVGNDEFRFESAGGADTIYDFTPGADVIAVAAGINGTTIATAADLLSRLANNADGNAVLSLDSGQSVTLIGVHAASLSSADFLIF